MLRILVDEYDSGGFQRPLNAKQSMYGDPKIFGTALNSFYRGQSEARAPGKFSLTDIEKPPGCAYLARIDHCPYVPPRSDR